MSTTKTPDPQIALPRLVAALHATARVAAVVPVAVGVLVLFGWWFDIELLKRIVPGLVAMNPITAVGFLCLGISLALVSQDGRRHRVGEALALLAALFGFIRLVAIVGG